MKRVVSLLGMALALASLVGCGLKGPLYFPTEQTDQHNKAVAHTPDQTVNDMVGGKAGVQAK